MVRLLAHSSTGVEVSDTTQATCLHTARYNHILSYSVANTFTINEKLR
jgi:hypothetical protein